MQRQERPRRENFSGKRKKADPWVLPLALTALLAAAGLTLPAGRAAAQDQIVQGVRVSVVPLWYDEDLGVGENLSQTVQTTVQWTIRFLQGYELVEAEDYPAGQMEMVSFVREYELDNVIFGRVSYAKGEYSISLLLYDAERDQIVEILQESVASVMDIFDLADQLSVGILERFIGRELVFGSLGFQDTGEAGEDYEVLINETSLGVNPQGIPRFLTGTYRFRVRQLSREDEILLLDEMVEVKESERTTLEFRTFSYGKVIFRRRGPDVPFTLYENGEPFEGPYGEPLIREAGEYSYRLEQMDPFGEPRVMETWNLTMEEAAAEEFFVVTRGLSKGFRFEPSAGHPYTVILDREPLEGESPRETGVVPAGKYRIRIQQEWDNGGTSPETRIVFRGKVNAPLGEHASVEFPVFPSKEAWEAWYARQPDLQGVFQGLGCAYGYAGLRWEGLGRRLGAEILAGGYQAEGGIGWVAQAKIQWLPLLGSAPLAPSAGLGAFLNPADPDSGRGLDFFLGPQVGLSWNTGFSFLPVLFVENGFYYRWGDVFRMGYRLGLGVRF